MIKAILISFGIYCLITSGSSVAATDENTLDEITIRMISDDSLPIDVTEIELPDVAGGQTTGRSNNHGSGRSDAAKQANEHAVQGSNNAANQAENAAENAANASENASSNAAEALSNAPGQNK